MIDRLPRPTPGPAGFSYIALLIFIAILGVISAASLQLGSLLQRRAAEEELLAVGTEFRNALVSFANATIPGQNRLPRTLEDLLKDPRYPNPRRHLRKIYTDPISGSSNWGLIPSVDGRGIIGIYSQSDLAPIKINGFDVAYQSFSVAATYRDWRFIGNPADAPIKPNNQPNQPGGFNSGGVVPPTPTPAPPNQVPNNPEGPLPTQ
jgi:type II secretory pathway pseudopilin PulG